jgi:tetratricopeptide (TPR) repeat protein
MTRAAKIGITVAVLVGIGLFLAVGVIGLLTFRFFEGVRLADEGYAAMQVGNYDVAMARFDVALKRPIGAVKSEQVHFIRGIIFDKQLRHDQAIVEFTEVLRSHLWLGGSAYEWRGWSYEKKGDLNKALDDFGGAIRCNPNSGFAYYHRGSIRFEKREYDLALSDFGEAARCDMHPASALIMRARAYIAKNDLERALASCDGAIAIEPTSALNYNWRSYVYALRKEYDKRDRDYAEALRLDPHIDDLSNKMEWSLDNSNKWSLNNSNNSKLRQSPAKVWAPTLADTIRELFHQAEAAYKQGDYDRAIAIGNDLLLMDLSVAIASRAFANRGNAYSGKGDEDRAMRDYDEAINLDPCYAGAYVDRGLLLSKKGEHSEARKDFGEALRLNPNQWEAYYDRGADFRDERKLEEAIADFSKAIDLNPSYPSSYVNRASVYAMKGEVDCALGDYEKALKLNPNLADVYFAQARIYFQQHHYSEAAHDLEKAETATERISARTLNSIAWMQATSLESSLRNGEKAVEAAKKACELTNWKNWAYVDTLAAAYAEAGDFGRAVQCQEKAIALAPPSYWRIEDFRERLSLYRAGIHYREAMEYETTDH